MSSTKELINLRHKIHSIAEISGNENNTAGTIKSFLQTYSPDEIITGIGGHGLAAIFDSGKPGPRVLIRCELDALPIPETIEIKYGSGSPTASHKCGHDGHMAIVAGLAPWLKDKPLANGSVVLLFQPAEEIGKGAYRVLQDNKFKQLKPDYVFALHNLPGFPLGQVISREGFFAAASKGLKIFLNGETSHAAEPEEGKSPALAVAQLIQSLSAVPQYYTALHESSKVTIIHAEVGEIAFGTSPGKGQVMATLRSYSDDVMNRLVERCIKLAHDIARVYDLELEVEWDEEFPSTVNDPKSARLVEECATEFGLEIHRPEYAFPWSEDFGHFTSRYPGALFGLGSGENHPALHSPFYNFPDNLIDIGTRLFREIIIKVIGRETRTKK